MAQTEAAQQPEIDQANMAFWNELCGTGLARTLGITDSSPDSLKRFDDWYMDFYSYLERYIPFESMWDKRVLEVGLGYGTIAQRLMEHGAHYHGLDIAANPVTMARHRMQLVGGHGVVKQGSVLDCLFDSNTFDWVITIGCLHHTGDMPRAINEVYRVLKPDGRALLMVYNATSYRQWSKEPWSTLLSLLGSRVQASSTETMRRAYDKSLDGAAAPNTEFVTPRKLRYLCRAFRSCRINKENIGNDGWFRSVPRRVALRYAAPFLGLDLYCRLQK